MPEEGNHETGRNQFPDKVQGEQQDLLSERLIRRRNKVELAHTRRGNEITNGSGAKEQRDQDGHNSHLILVVSKQRKLALEIVGQFEQFPRVDCQQHSKNKEHYSSNKQSGDFHRRLLWVNHCGRTSELRCKGAQVKIKCGKHIERSN